MGILVAKKYPTRLFLKAADHTYVECGNGGMAWSCWGGKIHGTVFNSGTGSTKRANAIAEPNERAGISCYLVNGVCHQAANRILVPAGILVSAARGYALSQAIFGPYGRAGVWPCSSPFNQHAGVSGDLAACAASATPMAAKSASSALPKLALSKVDRAQTRRIKSLYNRFDPKTSTALDALQLNIQVFERDLAYRFQDAALDQTAAKGLKLAKTAVETGHHQINADWTRQQMSPVEFVANFNRLTDRFQDDCANALKKTQYRRLLDLEPDERLTLADPDALDSAFGKGTARRVYGKLLPATKT